MQREQGQSTQVSFEKSQVIPGDQMKKKMREEQEKQR